MRRCTWGINSRRSHSTSSSRRRWRCSIGRVGCLLHVR
jgi:hypothetical protein